MKKKIPLEKENLQKESSDFSTLSPLDGRYREVLQPLRQIFCEQNLQKMRLKTEVEWLLWLSEMKLDLFASGKKISKQDWRAVYENFNEQDFLKLKNFEKKTRHDVKAMELFLRDAAANIELKAPISNFIHFGMTSEDTNNLAYAFLWKDFLQKIWLKKTEELLVKIKTQAKQWNKIAMVGRTHGQIASPTTLGKEWMVFHSRLERQFQGLKHQKIFAKFGGAVGNHSAWVFSKPKVDWQKICKNFVENFGFEYPFFTTQIEPHDYLAEIFHHCIRWNSILLNFSQDLWGYIALGYFQQKNVDGEIGSSTMPHKINPIDFENAEGNLGLANSMLNFMANKLTISRWQRDLSDSTVLRNVGVAFGYSFLALTSFLKGLNRIEPNQTKMQEELNHSWEVLLEPIQTLLRIHGQTESMEKSWQSFRGEKLDQKTIQKYIQSLPLPEKEKERLLQLSPATYLGYSSKKIS